MAGDPSPGVADAEESRPHRVGGRAGDVVLGLVLLLCLSPAILRYADPVQPAWDEASFLWRTVCVNKAAAALDPKAFVACFEEVKRPPLMVLSALPFGALATSPAGLALIPLSYGIVQWLMAVGIVVLLLVVRVPRGIAVLAAASVGTAGAITAHAARLLGDMPFALTVALVILLVPLEARAGERSGGIADAKRGALWGLVLALGLLGKMTFLVFAGVIGVTLVVLRWRARGVRSVATTVAAALVAAAPGLALVALLWERLVAHAQLAAFGSFAQLYSAGMGPLRHLATVAGSAPLLATVCAGLAASLPLAFRFRRRATLASIPGILAVCLYEATTLASPNQDPRFQLPTLVALPFALAVAWARLEEPGEAECGREVLPWVAAGLLLVTPLSARYDFSNVLEQAHLLRSLAPASGSALVLIATDSPQLNAETLGAARELVPDGPSRVRLDTAVYDDVAGRDLAFSLTHRVAPADYLILQTDRAQLWPEWTNRRAEDFRRLARTSGRLLPELSTRSFEVYAMRSSARQ